jgi:uncharacterized protein YjbJ (UPF0337 family)
MVPQERDQEDDWNGNSNQPKEQSSPEALSISCAVDVRAGCDTNVGRTQGFRRAVAKGRYVDSGGLRRRRRNRMVRTSFMRSLRRMKEVAMDWNRVEGNCKQMKGAVKQQWGKLTDDDLTQIEGSREKLEGIIQERYGIARDETRKQIDAWYQRQGWQ